MNVSSVQQRLHAQGFNPGPVDGIIGPRTTAAVRRFQQHAGLVATGILDLKTMAAMGFPPNLNTYDPDIIAPWMAEVQRRRDLHERRDNKTLWDWLRSDGSSVGDPAVNPWCGDLTETAIALTLPAEPLPENPYLALNWTKFGIALEKGIYGAVLVFWRGSPDSWKGHVGFYWGEDRTHYHVFGGNQGNAVNVARIAKNRLRKGGIRWPATVTHRTQPRYLSPEGLWTSTNEA